jgi:hypothetical protein
MQRNILLVEVKHFMYGLSESRCDSNECSFDVGLNYVDSLGDGIERIMNGRSSFSNPTNTRAFRMTCLGVMVEQRGTLYKVIVKAETVTSSLFRVMFTDQYKQSP